MVVRLKGKIITEKNCELIIELTEDDAEEFNIKEGTEVKVEFEKLEKFSDD